MTGIDLTVRSLDDVRKAHLYFTAAPQQKLSVFVDSAEALAQFVKFATECLQHPVVGPVVHPSCCSTNVVPIQSPSKHQKTNTDGNVNQIIDQAFAALSEAQDCAQANDLVNAVTWSSIAEAGFGKAQTLVTDARMQKLFEDQRQIIRQHISTLQQQLQSSSSSSTAPAPAPASTPPPAPQSNMLADLPPAPGVNPSNTSDGAPQMQALDNRLRNLELLAQKSPTSNIPQTLTGIEPSSMSPTASVMAVMDVAAQQRPPDTSTMDQLRARLQALKNESIQPVDHQQLCARLGKLHQNNPNDPDLAVSAVTAATLLTPVPKDPVQAIIAQVQDEIRLGLEEDHDDEVDEDDFSESVDSDDSDDSSENRSNESKPKHRPDCTK